VHHRVAVGQCGFDRPAVEQVELVAGGCPQLVAGERREWPQRPPEDAGAAGDEDAQRVLLELDDRSPSRTR
jgi:hypothetical protein